MPARIGTAIDAVGGARMTPRKPRLNLADLALEPLLNRPALALDPGPVRTLVGGRRVLVTGAGGSIGTELCRQLASLDPGELVMCDRYENGLHAIAMELAHRPFVRPVVGDVTDTDRMRVIFERSRPDLVFHAAAHKHVPLMEANPAEAVKNNVTGTRIVAEAAARHGASRFVLISTDKAVRPSSVMGATKHVAELVVRDLEARSRTRFVTVRFGNVLGSNGSVLPRFLDQINAGGPVTVTHPEVRRFFMLIPEAVQLVLHAAAIEGPRSVYVLDLGEQTKIVDLARAFIRQAGLVPDADVAIEIIGLRPGEKLSEELVDEDETREPSPVPQIFGVRIQPPSRAEHLASAICALERLAVQGLDRAVVAGLRRVVPSFTPDGLWADGADREDVLEPSV